VLTGSNSLQKKKKGAPFLGGFTNSVKKRESRGEKFPSGVEKPQILVKCGFLLKRRVLSLFSPLRIGKKEEENSPSNKPKEKVLGGWDQMYKNNGRKWKEDNEKSAEEGT